MEKFLNKIILSDCLTGMKELPDNSINLCVTSPPYANARLKTYGGIHPDKYLEWFRPIAAEIYRLLTPDGSFILNIGDNTVDGETHLYTFEIPIMLKRELGFKFIDPLIWHKRNCPPGKYPNRFKGSWEFCYHFSRSTSIKFNPMSVAQPTKEQSIARSLRQHEHCLDKSLTGSGFTGAARNIGRRIRKNGSGISTNDEQLKLVDLSLPSNVLHLGVESTNVGHSAPFPTEIPEFFIKAFSDHGDLILEPFSGSGTTPIVCSKLSRNFIAFENNLTCFNNSQIRLQKELGLFNTQYQ